MLGQSGGRNLLDIILQLAEDSDAVAVGVVISIFVYTIIMAWLFTKVISASVRLPEPSALISALCLLTFVSLTGAIITQSSALETLSATGVGAIAGAVSHRFNIRRSEEDERKSIPSQADSETEGTLPRLPDSEE